MRDDSAEVANDLGVAVNGGDEDIEATFSIGKRVRVAVMVG